MTQEQATPEQQFITERLMKEQPLTTTLVRYGNQIRILEHVHLEQIEESLPSVGLTLEQLLNAQTEGFADIRIVVAIHQDAIIERIENHFALEDKEPPKNLTCSHTLELCAHPEIQNDASQETLDATLYLIQQRFPDFQVYIHTPQPQKEPNVTS